MNGKNKRLKKAILRAGYWTSGILFGIGISPAVAWTSLDSTALKNGSKKSES